MKPRFLPPLLLLLLIPVGRSAIQQSFDSKQAELTVWARLKTMTPSDLQTVIAKAQGGDAEAQYWVGLVYGEGRLVPKDAEEAARWFLKSAEQGYAPAQPSTASRGTIFRNGTRRHTCIWTWKTGC